MFYSLSALLSRGSRQRSGALSFVRAFALVLVLNTGVAPWFCQEWRGPRGPSCSGAAGEEVVGAPAGGHSLLVSQPSTAETLSPPHRGIF